MGLHVDTAAVQWHFTVVLFFKLLFWISFSIKFKCLYVVGVQKILSMSSRYTRQEQKQTIIGTVNSSQLCSTKWSARHMILSCDELTV